MIRLPEQFTERMKGMLGEEYEAFAASYEKERVQGLRFNSLKWKEGEREDWEEKSVLELVSMVEREAGFSLSPIPWVKEGFYYGAEDRPGRHPFHEAGMYYTQEPSAMAVAELLDPLPGERILDLCAAPGGKSSHIASRLKGKGFLLSNEIHPARARILSQNIERMGAANVVVSNESPDRLAVRFGDFFHKIVVDAPCSGEGMFRKDEEARAQWSEEHVRMCAARQAEILDCAASMLAPGGRLVYSTCTFAPEENEKTILDFLKRHEGFEIEPVRAYSGFSCGRSQWAGPDANGWGLEDTFRIMPHLLEGEGHFMAVLKKAGSLSYDLFQEKGKSPYLDAGKKKEVWKAAEPVWKELLTSPEVYLNRNEYLLFGDQLYLLPPEMKDLKGLKILRPGLHMGTLKKNRFEPSHAFSLALKKEEAASWVELPSKGEAIRRYLRGETLTEDQLISEWNEHREENGRLGPQKGWALVCTGGCSLGWGKWAGGILKNHYPKGLRWNV